VFGVGAHLGDVVLPMAPEAGSCKAWVIEPNVSMSPS
jgi:hypothetical protein